MAGLYVADNLAAAGRWDEAEAVYTALAEAGDPRGWTAIARRHRSGPRRDPFVALALFERAAGAGSADGALQAALLLLDGVDGDPDPLRALHHFEWAARLGAGPIASTRAGWIHLRGEAGRVDIDAALVRFRRAVVVGVEPEAMLGLGHAYAGAGAGGRRPADLCEAVHWFRLAALAASDLQHRATTEAMRERFAGWTDQAIGWVHRLLGEVRRLAGTGDGDACHQYAEAMAGRFLGEVEDAEVVSWLLRAVEGGSARACVGLAARLRTGDGVAPDPSRARELLALAAAAGVGHHDYGHALVSGLGAAPDPEGAIEQYRLAAAGGSPAPARDLATLLIERDGDGDAAEATGWLRRAAEAGDTGAMVALAGRYRDGVGTPVDLVRSARWYLAPIHHGDGDGIAEIGRFCRSMTADQLRAADRLAGLDGSRADDLVATFLASDR